MPRSPSVTSYATGNRDSPPETAPARRKSCPWSRRGSSSVVHTVTEAAALSTATTDSLAPGRHARHPSRTMRTQQQTTQPESQPKLQSQPKPESQPELQPQPPESGGSSPALPDVVSNATLREFGLSPSTIARR